MDGGQIRKTFIFAGDSLIPIILTRRKFSRIWIAVFFINFRLFPACFGCFDS